MSKLIDTLGTPDQHGVRHINRDTKGCPHCGHVDVKFDATGTIALWHPGAECCEDRIQDQIRWRRAEIASNDHKLDQAIKQLNEDSKTKDFKGDVSLGISILEGRTAALNQALSDELADFSAKLTKIRQSQTTF